MLITRILTASILAPLAIALVWLLPPTIFAEVVMLLMVLALFEWDGLTEKSDSGFVMGALGVLLIGIVVYLLDFDILPNQVPSLLPLLIAAGVVFWVLQITVLARGIDYHRPVRLEWLYSLLIVLFAWAAMTWLRHQDEGNARVLIAIMVVWAADTFAYIAGVSVGRRKLAPSISPGKTIEGVIGGIAGALLVAWLGAHFLLDMDGSQLVRWLLAALGAALISVAGDLYVSRLKRHAGVKDSGKLLPGHAGLLDRIDGLLAAMPIFAGLWWWLS